MKPPFETLLPLVEKPSRYIGNEINTSRKSFEQASVHVCLAFPDLYEIGISHLGLKILYSIINNIDFAMADRTYLPWIDMIDAMRREGIPLFGLESRQEMMDFDLIGITLQSELTFTNVLELIDLSGIPIRSANRLEEHPIIMAGGPCASNPLPLSPFIDVFFLGEAEDGIISIINVFQNIQGRKQRLAALSALPGCYVPAIHDDIIASDPDFRVRVQKFSAFSSSTRMHEPQLLPWQLVTHNRYAAEIMRGCSRGCRFCHAGYFYRPIRERDPQTILDQILSEIKSSGWDEAGLLSLSSSDYTCIRPLLKALLSKVDTDKTHISLPSLRVDGLDDDLIQLMRELGREGLTIAPEAGSQGLRNVINKNLTEADIIEGVEVALRLGWQRIKLYFMIGLPFEQEEDSDAIIELISKIDQLARRRLQINVTLSPYIPKPYTPFQFAAFENRSVLLARILNIKHHFQRSRNIKIRYHEIETSWLEALISRGDKQIAEVIENAWRLGARFDGWNECFDFSIWDKASAVIDSETCLASRALDYKAPWSFIDTGVRQQFHILEWQKAKAGQVTEDCRKTCAGCAVCDSELANDLRPEQSTLIIPNRSPQTFYPQTAPRYHYRIFYRKLGYLRFISHLDWMRMLYRLVGMIDLPVIYTQGFNPHPRISLSPPLPVGVQGRCEYFDLSFWQPVLPGQVIDYYNGLGIQDLEFYDGQTLSGRSNHNPERESISIILPDNLLDGVRSLLENFSKTDHLTFAKTKKEKTKTYDLKQIIISAHLDQNTLWIDKKLESPALFDLLEVLTGLPKIQLYSYEIFRESIDPE